MVSENRKKKQRRQILFSLFQVGWSVKISSARRLNVIKWYTYHSIAQTHENIISSLSHASFGLLLKTINRDKFVQCTKYEFNIQYEKREKTPPNNFNLKKNSAKKTNWTYCSQSVLTVGPIQRLASVCLDVGSTWNPSPQTIYQMFQRLCKNIVKYLGFNFDVTLETTHA